MLRKAARGSAIALLLLGCANAYAVALDPATDFAGNQLVNGDNSTNGLLAFDLDLLNTSSMTVVVQVGASEVSDGSIAYNSLVYNHTPLDLVGFDLAVDAPAAFGTVGTVLDSGGTPISGITSTATSAAIPFDPPLQHYQPPAAAANIELGNVGLGDEPPGTMNWEIDVSGLPAGGGTFTMHLAAVPEPAGSDGAVLAALIALRLYGRRAKPCRLG